MTNSVESQTVFTSRKERDKRDIQLGHLSFDPEFTPGARNAVNVCLRVRTEEKVCVITDKATADIAASVIHELETLGCRYCAWLLEDLAPRPLNDLPREILNDLETSQVSIFAVQVQPNELRSRMQMTDVVNRRKIRHAHMVNINRQIMLEGMRADFQRVDRLSQKVVQMVRKASKIRATTAAGTDLTADLNELQVAEDEWNYYSRKVGQSARWGNFYDSRRSQWDICHRRCRRRLSLRQVWQLARDPTDDPNEGKPFNRGAFGKS